MDETLPPTAGGQAGDTGLTPALRRLLFRANHRGTRENDLLIGGFVSARIGQFSDIEIAALEAILQLPDPLIGDFLTGRGPMPQGCDAAMLTAMREAALARSQAV
jgi:antitoxin CptB